MKRMGIEGQLFYGVAGSTASTLVSNCRSPSYKINPKKADTTSRTNLVTGTAVAITTERVVAIGYSIKWTMLEDETDAILTALKNATLTGAAVALRTKSYASGTGLDGDFNVNFEKDESDEKEQTLKFTASTTDAGGRLPTWH